MTQKELRRILREKEERKETAGRKHRQNQKLSKREYGSKTHTAGATGSIS